MTSNQRFKPGEMLFLYFDGDKLPLAESGEHMITVHDADLDVERAIQLRDWLTKVIPVAPLLKCTCPGGPKGPLGFHNMCPLHGLEAQKRSPDETTALPMRRLTSSSMD